MGRMPQADEAKTEQMYLQDKNPKNCCLSAEARKETGKKQESPTKSSEGINSSDILNLDSQPPEL